MKKKLFSLLLCFVLLAALVSPVRAEQYDDLRQQMIESVKTGEKFDMRGCEITVEELQDMYSELYNSGQLPWYADTRFDWTMGPDGFVAVFDPRGLKELRYDEAKYERKMAELLAATCTADMPQWMIALNVHDYIVTHCEYDRMLVRNNGYQALVNGTSACFGYAQLYMDVMKRVGIPCQIAVCDDVGNGLGHAWNVIQLDGEWYHVDLTWDDPVEDAYGRVLHTHFLKTDRQFRSAENGHDFGWECAVKCSGKRYSGETVWSNVESQITCVDETLYLRRSDRDTVNIVSVDGFDAIGTVLYTLERNALDLGAGRYIYPIEGMTYWNDRLYFNSEDTVYSMQIDGSDIQKEFVYDTSANGKFIYSSFVDNGTLYLELSDHDFLMTHMEIALENVNYHTHDYVEAQIPATCAQEGYTEYTCVCDVSYRLVTAPALEHTLESKVVREAAVGQEGVIRHSCTACSYYEDEAVPPLPAEETAEATESAANQTPFVEITWIPVLTAIVAAVVVLSVVLLTRKKRK